MIYVSDNESWVDAQRAAAARRRCSEWAMFKARNPRAKLVCIDIQPYETQAAGATDVLNIGGFSDGVFDVIAEFADGRSTPTTGSASSSRSLFERMKAQG